MIQPRARHSIEELAKAAHWAGGIKKGRGWDVVEREIGITLPDDYKEMMSIFPSGFFRNAVSFNNPIDERTDFEKFVREDVRNTIEVIGDRDLDYLEDTDYRLFPEPGGLLPWGNDMQGGMFCWLTKPDDPNQWPVAYYSQDLLEWSEHNGGTIEVIWEILTHVGDDNILHRRLDHELPIFRVPSTYMGNDEWLPHAEYR
ncbi:SMI1/KNR4 family protein [Amycolatopsis sp. NBC_01480]|jgi:hypothetical protein|uniref:SMI1/KNR4 family protein n=1 Tax=Amycolatopsis sp. NBC_01480 TaxID=2903562 RepID=UPI002E2A21E3|nr:SMI1/KNR4 family protein [Amycolatopsis sp. NBC_01480]